jgi:hypothetical protein
MSYSLTNAFLQQLYQSLLISKRLIDMIEEKNMTDEEFAALFKHIEMLTPVSSYWFDR